MSFYLDEDEHLNARQRDSNISDNFLFPEIFEIGV